MNNRLLYTFLILALLVSSTGFIVPAESGAETSSHAAQLPAAAGDDVTPTATPLPPLPTLPVEPPAPEPQAAPVEPAAAPAPLAQVITVDNAQNLTLQRLEGAGIGSLHKLAVSPDGKTVLLSYSTSLVLLDAASFSLIWHVDPGRLLLDVVFTKDGNHVVAYSAGGTLLMFDSATGALLKTVLPQREGVRSMALSGRGEYFAILDYSGVTKVYDTSTGNEVMKNNGQSYPGGLNSIQLTPGGGTLLIDGFDSKPRKQVQQWNVTDGKYKIGLLGLIPEMTGWKFSPDAKRVFSINTRSLTSVPANMLTVWNTSNGALIKSFPSVGIISDYIISPDGATVLVATSDKKLHLLDTESGKEKGVFESHSMPVVGMDFTPDSQGVISLDAGGHIKIWDVVNLKIVNEHDGAYTYPGTGMMFSEDGRLAVVISPSLASVDILDTSKTSNETVMRSDEMNLRAPAISGAADLAAAVDAENRIHVWEVASGKKLQMITAKTRSPIQKVKFSPDGKTIASLSEGQVFLWDIATGARKVEFSGQNDLAWSVDGAIIASDSTDNRLYLTDTATGRKAAALDAEAITSINYSADGSLIAVGGTRVQPKERGLINLVFQFDSKSRVRLPVEMPKQAGAVVYTVYSPDRSLLAGVDTQGNVYLWSMLDGSQVAYFEEIAGYPATLAFNKEGTLLYVGGSDGAIGVISTIGGTAAADSPATPAEPGGDVNAVPELSAQPYTHSRGSVSAKLPMGWNIEEPSSLSFVSSDPAARGFIAFAAINTMSPLDDEAFTRFVNGFEAGLAATVTDYKEIDRGMEAAKGSGFVSKTVTLAGNPYIFESYYDRDGSVIRQTSFITRKEYVEAFIPLYQGVYASLKIDWKFIDSQMPYTEGMTLTSADGAITFDVPGGWWKDPADPAGRYMAPDKSAFVQQVSIPWDEKTMTDNTAIFGVIQTFVENQEGYVTMLRREKLDSGGWQITYSVSGTDMTGVATGIKVNGTMQIVNVEYLTSMASKYYPLAAKLNTGLKKK